MQQSWMNLETIALNDGTICGISLGADYSGEHERGIRNLSEALGCGHTGRGRLREYQARPVQESDLRLSFYERSRATKTIAPEVRLSFHVDAFIAQDLAVPRCKRLALPAISITDGIASKGLAASWSDNGFCIRAFGEAERDTTRALHRAALTGDLLVSIAGRNGNPFARGGLCLISRSLLTDRAIDDFCRAGQEDECVRT